MKNLFCICIFFMLGMVVKPVQAQDMSVEDYISNLKSTSYNYTNKGIEYEVVEEARFVEMSKLVADSISFYRQKEQESTAALAELQQTLESERAQNGKGQEELEELRTGSNNVVIYGFAIEKKIYVIASLCIIGLLFVMFIYMLFKSRVARSELKESHTNYAVLEKEFDTQRRAAERKMDEFFR